MYCQKCNMYYDDNVKFCTNCGEPCVSNPQPQNVNVKPMQNIPYQKTPMVYPYPSQSMQLPKQKGKKTSIIILSIICAIFLITTVVASIIAFQKSEEADENAVYYYRYSTIEDEYDFFHEYGYVANSGDSYYHHYKCDKFDDEKSFNIFNKKRAESEGFKPCPDCIGKN